MGDEVGFYLALNYFETHDIISWLVSIRSVPRIFVNVLCYVDRKLSIALSKSMLSGCIDPPSRRSFYNYLLINGCKLSSLLARCSGLTLAENEENFDDFKLFKNSIFYIGKGVNSRKEVHLKQAKRFFLGLTPLSEVNEQVAAISNCWENGGSLILVQFGNESNSFEAHCREAALIETIGVDALDNCIAGTKYREMRNWSETKLRNYGELTLLIVFKKFILQHPPPIKASDVHIRSFFCMKKKIPWVCHNCGHTLCTK